MSKEIWLPVEGYPLYHVSNHGRVRGPRKMLKPWDHRDGYVKVNLYVDGKKSPKTVHPLVAHAFIGPRPEGLEVHHKDEDKLNNHVDNLEYVTSQYNCEFSQSKHYKFINPMGEVVEVFNLRKFCRDYNLDGGSMFKVLAGKNNHHKQWRKA